MSANAILSDPRGHNLAIEFASEAIGIESDLLGIIDEHRHHIGRLAPRFLILVELVVHLPEAALQAGGLSRLGGNQRVFVRGGIQRIFPKDYAESIAEFTFDLLQFTCIRAARWTLEIAKLLQRHLRVWVAASVRRLGARRFRGRRICG